MRGAPEERRITTNLWAYCHWLRCCRGVALADGDAARRWALTDPVAFLASIADFARLPAAPCRLARHRGAQEALVYRGSSDDRQAWSRDDLLGERPGESPVDLPTIFVDLLRPRFTWEEMAGPMATLLLDADLRPDDRMLVAGCPCPAWPWVCALAAGATAIFAETDAAALERIVTEERPTVLVAPRASIEHGPLAEPAPRSVRVFLPSEMAGLADR